MNKTVKKVSQDIEDMKFNTAIAAMMTCLNEINDVGTLTKDELSVFIRLLCPFAPHLCEEMWEQLGEEGLCSTAKYSTTTRASALTTRSRSPFRSTAESATASPCPPISRLPTRLPEPRSSTR